MESNFRLKAAGLALLLLATLTAPVTPAQALTCQIAPEQIPIGLTYHGARIVISGESLPGEELLLKITTPPADAHLRFLGKAAGLVWMKMGSMEFKNVPLAYLLYSSKPVDQIMAPAAQQENHVGYESLKAASQVISSAGEVDRQQWLGEFIKLKESEHLYQIREGAIHLTPGASGVSYRLESDWPYQAAPGDYLVEVLAVRDGRVVNQAATTLKVAQAGIVAQISNLAFHNSAVYGIMAILVAMVAGFGVAALFKGGGGSH